MPLSLIGLILLGVASLAAAAYVFVGERSRREIVDRTTEHSLGVATPVFAHKPTIAEQLAQRIVNIAPKTWASNERTEGELVQAGYDGETAPLLYSATRLATAVSFPVVTLIVVPKHSFNVLVLEVMAAAIAGIILPPFVLTKLMRTRQQRIRHSLPDALDLLVICIEAGISLDAAILRVAKDLGSVHPELADELLVVTQKTNVGMPRSEALRGLWARTGVDEIRALVAHIVQAEKWGTSSGKVLRVFAETLRRNRRQAAEKKAATAPVKMLVPLGLFIFPALMLVIMGPIGLSIMKLFNQH